MQYKAIHFFLKIFIIGALSLNAQQININRINQMPNFPQPYLMRDWKEVATGYDSLVFNTEVTGQYLPLLFFRNNNVNYPGSISFGLHTVVGTPHPTSGEAINVIPAVVGASLIGIDKRNQNGYNWVEMCREYFNKRPEENVYLNHPSTESGDDWWYATMPNVFFYQLYNLYPQTIDFNYQLRSVADQWLKAVETMGGSGTPWKIPIMDYRGWSLSKMTPFKTGVKEPESAGAIAWLLYNAYKETGEKKYRIGAEWALEFLNNYRTNPSYELQLPYGVYIAAKMNAELGLEYNIEKMLNWCFDKGQLRNWGAILGKWGGLDVSGLIGEVNGSNDYAFLMNTFEQASALVPLLRYDDRFANSIGKWVLNASNASRLFYTNYLPDNKQDSEEWSHQYDTNSYIGHEAMRQLKYGASPYATGDAIDGNWGETNLALYASSHVGIFGSIIETTNIEGILKLDLLKTDYFNEEVYPSYLIYNPHEESKTVELNIGLQSTNIYETTQNMFILQGVTGDVQITLPSKTAYIIVLTPSSGILKYEYDKLLVNNIVVDYSSGQTVSNYPPRIKSLATEKSLVLKGDSVTIYCTTIDKDNDEIFYTWSNTGGEIIGEGEKIVWIAPNNLGTYNIQVEVNDGNGHPVTELLQIEVIEGFNTAPKINRIIAEPRKIDIGGETEIECFAIDDENDSFEYVWSSVYGNINGNGEKIIWSAPEQSGNYSIVCSVIDSNGNGGIDSIIVSVRDLSSQQSGNLICHLPFSSSAEDVSGNNNSVSILGAVLTNDRFNVSGNAYKFDGENDNIKITNSSLLNFDNSISLNFWININELFEREQYPISHGSWEKRWKVSISNERIRWTIKTSTGIVDLDSETIFEINKWYNITVIYSGFEMELYINGKLDAFKYWSGNLSTSNLDLTIGQSQPNDNNYNFNGKLDEIRIYDYSLSLETIKEFYDISTSVEKGSAISLPLSTQLNQNYPNPFNGQTQITYDINKASEVSLIIYDILGRRLNTLVDEYKNPGKYSVLWNSKDSNGNQLASGIYLIRLKSNNYIGTKKIILLQ